MPRAVHVKKAQQRYAMVPVLDESGQPKQSPVMKADGDQKTTKRGKPVFMKVTVTDKGQPLPMPECDYSGCQQESREIKVGTPYKHLTYKSSTYGSRTLTRHEQCPTWNVWEYSSSMSARLAQIDHDNRPDLSGVDSAEDVTSALESYADEIDSLADEKKEAADNIEEGFGTATFKSEELAEIADSLHQWADEIRSADVVAVEDYPCEDCEGDGEVDCDQCSGTGKVEVGEGDVDCGDCEGTGKVDCDACDDEHLDIDAWREAAEESLSVLDDCPV